MSSTLDSLFDELDQQELAGSAPMETEDASEKKEKKEQQQPAEKYAKSMVFVRGLPRTATSSELEEFFSSIGPVRSCFVVGDKKQASDAAEGDEAAVKKAPAGNRGFGFVQFVLSEDATRAIQELADVKFRNQKRLTLDFAMKKRPRPADEDDSEEAKPEAKQPRKDTTGDKPKRSMVTKVESRTITIAGLPAGVTRKHLVKKLKKVGEPHSIVYPAPFKDATEEQLQDGAGGTAHVTMEDHRMALKAVRSLNDHTFKGVKLSVRLKQQFIDKSARVIVRNLPFKVREPELERLLSDCGLVLGVDLPRKSAGGLLRGFGFVQMGDLDSAKRAVAKWNGAEVQGRTLSVDLAIAKDRFKEMEESGEIQKPEFAGEQAEATGKDDHAAADSASEGESDDGMDVDAAENSDSEPAKDVVDESLQEGCTLFIRNLSFESDEDGLFELFRTFGRLRYCRVVYDFDTGRSRGTAFVCFWNPADAKKCLDAAAMAEQHSEKLANVPSQDRSDNRVKTVLLQETPAELDSTSQFVLDGRMLSVAKAVDRNSAGSLAEQGAKNRKGKDQRNAYLLKEGVVFPDTPAAELMAPADLEHHVKEYGVRKNQILKNPNLFMSKTRLTVHNVPRSIDDAGLRSAAMSAIDKFKQEVKTKGRQPLSKGEMEEGWDKRARLVQAKIVRSKERVEGNSGKARSMGYGFLEFNTHAHALACLRYLNFRNSKQAFSKHLVADDDDDNVEQKSTHKISRRSLRVMFAIENAQIVKKRELRFTLAAKRQRSKDEKATGKSPATARAANRPDKAANRPGKSHTMRGKRKIKSHRK
ncbi:RNA recognition motif-containing protein [Coemansia sp. RSA 552]|nr:RNA recognition motif-containing protein [Coemansia sp. RSA 552]